MRMGYFFIISTKLLESECDIPCKAYGNFFFSYLAKRMVISPPNFLRAASLLGWFRFTVVQEEGAAAADTDIILVEF